MNRLRILGTLTALGGALLAAPVLAQEAQSFSAADFTYGPRDVVEGEIPIWSTAKQKILAGQDLVGGSVNATDPRTYCAMANAGYDFTWVEMQHQSTSWEQVARMWATCPDAAAVPGVRISYTDEREVQRALDSGAMVIVFPTVDSVEEAREAVSWVKFPPLGRQSQGGGQRFQFYADVPGTYRKTFNDNVVVIFMIETLEGVEAVHEIAKVPGVDALFVASSDLANFSGYTEGQPEYEALVAEIETAARDNGLALCGPLRWRPTREGYTCFQAGSEVANIARGVTAELAASAREGEAATTTD